MPDHGDTTDLALPPDARAVKYVLDRIQRDPDLRDYMLGTQAFALLIAAEAERLGVPAAEVEARRLGQLERRTPDVVALRDEVERLRAEVDRLRRGDVPDTSHKCPRAVAVIERIADEWDRVCESAPVLPARCRFLADAIAEARRFVS